MPKRFPRFFALAILLLLAIALVCMLDPQTIFGTAWRPWIIGAAVAWAVGRFLDELVPKLKNTP